MSERKVFVARRGHWRIEVSGEDKDAHIHAFGQVPRDVKKSIELKEGCGFKSTFKSLEFIATQLTA